MVQQFGLLLLVGLGNKMNLELPSSHRTKGMGSAVTFSGEHLCPSFKETHCYQDQNLEIIH